MPVAQGMHAGEEGLRPAVHSAPHNKHEERAVVSDAVDVRRLTHHQATW